MKAKFFAGLVGLMLISTGASATLLGEQVQGSFRGLDLGSNTITDSGTEFFVAGPLGAFATADFTDTGLILLLYTGTIDFFNNTTWEFTLLDSDLSFLSATEITDTYINGASFTGLSNRGKTASFFISAQFTSHFTTYSASYDIQVQNNASVPAPSTLALMAIGAMSLRLFSRKQKTEPA